jgi:hypothetical protein
VERWFVADQTVGVPRERLYCDVSGSGSGCGICNRDKKSFMTYFYEPKKEFAREWLQKTE